MCFSVCLREEPLLRAMMYLCLKRIQPVDAMLAGPEAEHLVYDAESQKTILFLKA